MRPHRTLLALVMALGICACDKKDDGNETVANLPKGPPPAAAPVPLEAPPAEPDTPEEVQGRGEPEPTPAREELRLLATKGAPEVRSIRAERTEMYSLFSVAEKDDKADVNALVSAVQGFLWDEEREALAAAPSKLAAHIESTTAFAARFKKAGEELMAEVTAMNKENEERATKKKSPKHTPVKIDKVQRRASTLMKLGRTGGLLARSLLDEARIYAQLGSLAMRAELRQHLSPLKGRDLGYEQTNLAAQRVLWELNVEGAEEPAAD
ncbi:MAG: hypothetical protein AMXMBFR64_21820 [Myxococcales bacterium]